MNIAKKKKKDYGFFVTITVLFLLFSVLDVKILFSDDNRPAVKADKIVVIDPAHGGRDAGIVVDDKVAEKDIALDVALKIRKKSAGYGFSADLTRDKDIDLPLMDRKIFANLKSPSAVLNIVVGGSYDSSARGIKVYTWSEDLGMISLGRKKKLKNWSDNLPGEIDKAEKLRLSEEAQIAYSNTSRKLASSICDEISKLDGIPCTVEQAPIVDLFGIDAPAVTVEVFEITNQRDKAGIMDDSLKDSVASAVCKGISNFLSGTNVSGEK